MVPGLSPSRVWSDYIAPGLKDKIHQNSVENKYALVAEGTVQDRIISIDSGKLKLTRATSARRDHLLEVLGAGDLLGVSALCESSEPRWFYAATTVEHTQLSWYLLADVRAFLARYSDIELRLMRSLAAQNMSRYRESLRRRDQDVPARIASALIYMQRRFGEITENGIKLPTGMTQGEIAQMAGASRETVNKVLADFTERGWLAQRHRTLVILQPSRLEARAQ